ncbi:MAG: glycoside hydrolase family 31 protein [Opitutaceae bacterium]|nr:glycoside hydrolase family 31 protein [Opitutaceae bacterium]
MITARHLLVLLSVLAGPAGWSAETALRYAGLPAELAVLPCTPHSVRLVVGVGTDGAVLSRHPALLPREWPPAPLRTRAVDGVREMRVGNFSVSVSADPLKVRVQDATGRTLQEIEFDPAAPGFLFAGGAGPILGLGEGGPQFDRRGREYPFFNGQKNPDRPTLGARIAAPYVVGTEGWAIFVVSGAGAFDLRTERGRFTPRPEAPAGIDLIVFDAHEPLALLREMAELTGPAALPPRWALGYMQSHRTLENSTQILKVAATFREKRLPCDAVIYLGTGFTPVGWNRGFDSMEFNPRVFVRPAAEVFAELHRHNFKVAVHVVPPPTEPIVVTRADGTKQTLHGKWDGGVLHGSIPGEPGAAGDPTHIAAYWRRHEPVFAAGVDAWWPDEGDTPDNETLFARARLYYQGPLSSRPGQRPWNLQRNGYTGIARYGGWLWSGDVTSRWATLAAQVPVGINHSLTVTPFWGTDTGGFHVTPELTGELFVRWFQFSAFCPSFRSHGRAWQLRLPWGWSTTETGPLEANRPEEEKLDPAEWPNPAVEPICRRYLELRYRLLPYNYTLAREAHDTGLPLMRALWLHYPQDQQAAGRGSEFLWGRDLLVAPVVERGATARTLYLPAGTWFDWWTGERHEGGREITRAVDLATLPLFARAGAIIPLDPVRQYADEPVAGPTTLRIFPGADGEFTLYDDDGATLAYLERQGTRTRLAWNDASRSLRITAERSTGSPRARTFAVRLGSAPTERTVAFDGREVEIRF